MKKQIKIISFLETKRDLHKIAQLFEKNRHDESGLIGVIVKEPRRCRIAICEADVFESLVKIVQELDALSAKDAGSDAFGLLQDSFDKHPIPFVRKRKMGNTFLAFRARLGSIPMSWVPDSRSGRTRHYRTDKK